MRNFRKIYYHYSGYYILCVMCLLACEQEEKISLATIFTNEVTNITQTTAKSGGNITNDGNGEITSRGVVWGKTTNPTTEENLGLIMNVPDIGQYTSEITGLTRNTTYYVRAYATNRAGVAYGNELQFITEGEPAAIATAAISNITATSASGGGNITDDGGAEITDRGIVWDTSENPTIEYNVGFTSNGEGTGSFTSELSNLDPDTEYFIRAYSISNLGINYGNQVNFKTYDGTILVTTNDVNHITFTTAQCGGNIIFDGGSTITVKGVVWSTSEEPTIEENIGMTSDGMGSGSFTSNITGINPETNYYIRSYAINDFGVSYGNELSFTTMGTIVDIENNEYKTTTIGNQIWLAENLRTTKYNDGTLIPTGHNNSEWMNLTTGAFDIFPHSEIDGLDTDTEVLEAYGAIYNWYAVENGNLCPTGWRVPSIEDWENLTTFVGGKYIAGSKLKSTRTSPIEHPRWDSPNECETDEYNFSLLPSGIRSVDGNYYDIGGFGYWWSTTTGISEAWGMNLRWDSSIFGRYSQTGSKCLGLSVRCIKITD